MSGVARLRAPDAEAIRWFSKLAGGGLSDSERAAFDAWRRAPKHAAAFSAAEELWGRIDVALRDLPTDPDIVRERERILAQLGDGRNYGTCRVAVCAALVVGISVAIFPGNVDATRDLPRLLAHLFEPAAQTYATSVGQRSTVTLADGSGLSLNTNSAAEVRYDGAERKVVLKRGQALFEVAKGRRVPFVVYAGGKRIVATGTAFDVRLDRASLELTMLEGHVLVYMHAEQMANGRVPSGLPLSAGERLVARVGEPPAVSPVDVERITSWTRGRLVFLNTSLGDAIAEANRYSASKLILSDPRLADLRVSGVFRTGQPLEFGRAVAAIHPVTIDEGPGGEIYIRPSQD